MDIRSKTIVKTLFFCFMGSLFIAIIKIAYGKSTGTIAFIADGIHSLFDSTTTLIGAVSIILSHRPPDSGHPYGHHKFETVAAVFLALFLFLAAYEVGTLAYGRAQNPAAFPRFSFLGIFILMIAMAVNLIVARWESQVAKNFSSDFLVADSIHNQSDFWIAVAVLVSFGSTWLKVPYVDAVVSFLIAFYLFWMAVRLLLSNLKPLVDHTVLDPKAVGEIVASVDGVIHCHHIRSRGHSGHHFLDLNIHLSENITLKKAHEITHMVEDRLRAAFPGLSDVVIHTEPHNHLPCGKENQ